MPAGVTVYWNDTALRAAPRRAYDISVGQAAAFARARARWRHVARTISPSPVGLRVGSPDAALLEGGASAHEIAPTHGFLGSKARGFASGGPVEHPGFGGSPFMRPTAEAWPAMYNLAARRTFPKA